MNKDWSVKFLDNVERVDKWREAAAWAIGVINEYKYALESIASMGPDEAETEAAKVANDVLEKQEF